MKNVLSDMLGSIDETKVLADRDLETIPLRTRPAFEAEKRQAQADLGRMRVRYATELFVRANVLVLRGASEAFVAAVGRCEDAVVIAPSNNVYVKLAEAVAPSFGRAGEFTVHQLLRLDSELRAAAKAVDLDTDFPMPQIGEVRTFPEAGRVTGVADYVRALVRPVLGDALLVASVREFVIEAALARRFSGQSLRVVLVDPLASDSIALGSKIGRGAREVLVTKDAPVDDEFVQSVVRTGKLPKVTR